MGGDETAENLKRLGAAKVSRAQALRSAAQRRSQAATDDVRQAYLTLGGEGARITAGTLAKRSGRSQSFAEKWLLENRPMRPRSGEATAARSVKRQPASGDETPDSTLADLLRAAAARECTRTSGRGARGPSIKAWCRKHDLRPSTIYHTLNNPGAAVTPFQLGKLAHALQMSVPALDALTQNTEKLRHRGRKGALTKVELYGEDYYSRNGKLGQQARGKRYDHEQLSAQAKKGSPSRREKLTGRQRDPNTVRKIKRRLYGTQAKREAWREKMRATATPEVIEKRRQATKRTLENPERKARYMAAQLLNGQKRRVDLSPHYERIGALHGAGRSIKAIAREIGVSELPVRRALEELGCLPPSGRFPSEETLEEARQLALSPQKLALHVERRERQREAEARIASAIETLLADGNALDTLSINAVRHRTLALHGAAAGHHTVRQCLDKLRFRNTCKVVKPPAGQNRGGCGG